LIEESGRVKELKLLLPKKIGSQRMKRLRHVELTRRKKDHERLTIRLTEYEEKQEQNNLAAELELKTEK
jgi:hypothetical protein